MTLYLRVDPKPDDVFPRAAAMGNTNYAKHTKMQECGRPRPQEPVWILTADFSDGHGFRSGNIRVIRELGL